jgi:hypothetical protein
MRDTIDTVQHQQFAFLPTLVHPVLTPREASMFENPSRRNAPPQRLAFGDLPIPGTKAGAMISAGLVIIAWIAIPVAHIFILGTVGLGALVGLGLTWLHSRE